MELVILYIWNVLANRGKPYKGPIVILQQEV
jgi:hypothetical protein